MTTRSTLRFLPRTVARTFLCLAPLAAALTFAPSVRAIGDEIAVAARVFNGYTRHRLPDRSFEPETYAFANGGRLDSALAGDDIEKVSFLQIAQTLSKTLASSNYVRGTDPKKTKLMIFVFWGMTKGTSDNSSSLPMSTAQDALLRLSFVKPKVQLVRSAEQTALPRFSPEADEAGSALVQLGLEQKTEDLVDIHNAQILGFQTELWRAYSTAIFASGQDLLSELRANRYFVVLKAYDFQTALKEKRLRPLWETRFSIRQRGVEFEEQLPAMAVFASKYFGKELNNLVRRPLPNVKVEYGQFKVLD